MDTKMFAKVIIGIVVVLAAIPLVPVVLDALKTPDPEDDAQNVVRIQEAIDEYGDYRGYYPAALSILVPDFITEIPAANYGKVYSYDPQRGKVGLPGEFTPVAPQPSGSGLTPMTDGMTGLSVQNELNF